MLLKELMTAVQATTARNSLQQTLRELARAVSDVTGTSAHLSVYTPEGLHHCGTIEIMAEEDENQWEFLRNLLSKVVNTFDVPFKVDDDLDTIGDSQGMLSFRIVPKTDEDAKFLADVLFDRSLSASVRAQ